MLIQGDRVSVFMCPDQIAWVRVEENGNAARVVYANGKEGNYNIHTYQDKRFLQDLIARVANDQRFTPLRRLTEFVNFSNVLRVVIDNERAIAKVWYPNCEQYEFSNGDLEAIRARVSR